MRLANLILCLIVAGCGSATALAPVNGPLSSSSADEFVTGGYRVLYAFKGDTDGAVPEAGFTELGGMLYGTTAYGGDTTCQVAFGDPPYGCGTVYAISPSGIERVLYAFSGGQDGAMPVTSLTAVNGELYGTTTLGGGSGCYGHQGCGTIFKISASGAESVIHRFSTTFRDGAHPESPLIYVTGRLYGTTNNGGGHACGTFFSMSLTGEVKVIYRFKGIPDGCLPSGDLVYLHGSFYGTTGFSGAYTAGTVYKVDSSGKETVLHSFGKPFSDGLQPYGGVTALGGILYGTTYYGGGNRPGRLGHGTVFSITTSGDEHVIYRFRPDTEGLPVAGLLAYNDALYGTTYGQFAGPDQKGGTVFKLTLAGGETILHRFPRGKTITPPAHPVADLVVVNGSLYGTTSEGGGYSLGNNLDGAGVVFTIAP